jgi:chaperone modulatory protein CbpM
MNRKKETQVGILLDDAVEFSLSEVCHTCHVHAEIVMQLVEVGALEPRGQEPSQWRFTGYAIRRLVCAMNLQRDLGVNLAGAALALELLDEIDYLRDRLRILEGE